MPNAAGGPLFLYSTSPTPHEQLILELAMRRDGRRHRSRLRVIVMQTPLENPPADTFSVLWEHFGTHGIPIEMLDSGLAWRQDAYDAEVVNRLAQADLVLITGGDPKRLYDMTIGTPALSALRSASQVGAVLAGCSAGAVIVGHGMLTGKKDQRQPILLWDWLQNIIVAPHFGMYDITEWLHAFPGCPALGIPDGGVALILPGWSEVTSLSPEPLSICSLREDADVLTQPVSVNVDRMGPYILQTVILRSGAVLSANEGSISPGTAGKPIGIFLRHSWGDASLRSE